MNARDRARSRRYLPSSRFSNTRFSYVMTTSTRISEQSCHRCGAVFNDALRCSIAKMPLAVYLTRASERTRSISIAAIISSESGMRPCCTFSKKLGSPPTSGPNHASTLPNRSSETTRSFPIMSLGLTAVYTRREMDSGWYEDAHRSTTRLGGSTYRQSPPGT